MTAVLDTPMTEIADQLFGSVMAGDVDAVRALYTPDTKVWHNFDNHEQTRDENLQLLTWITANWSNFRYEDVRRLAIDGGFIQQHVMKGEGPDGKPFESPAVLFVFVGDGKITRIEEYFDLSQVPLG